MELFKASRQWANRPDDERFWTLGEMHAACEGYRRQAVEAPVLYRNLKAVPEDGEVSVVGVTGKPALMTHYAFGQVCARSEAPASYLRELPAPLAAECLNHGIQAHGPAERVKLMFHGGNGNLLLRSTTSMIYERVWNSELTQRLLGLEADGWRVAPARPAHEGQAKTRPATTDDVLNISGGGGLSVNVGDLIAPAGLYASDHDMFAFLINERRPIDDGSGKPIHRGFFMWNSEVGDKSWGICRFGFEHVCGNHIVWGARDVTEVKFRHMGPIDARIALTVQVELRRYANESASDEEAKVRRARAFVLAKTKEEVLDRLFKLRIPALTRGRAEQAYGLAEQNGYDPTTVWGTVQGITRVSQRTPYADEWVALDRAAGKVMEIAF